MAPRRKAWRMPRSRSAHAHKPSYANLRQLCAEDVASRHYFYSTRIQTGPASCYRIGWWVALADWWTECKNEGLANHSAENRIVVANQSEGRRWFSRNTGGEKITREHQCCRVWMQQRLFMTTMISAVIRDAFME
ncbi:hypothetical protein PGIGA_G00080760 [Pangasianodon gigas]|uniref:Uncharacterized protein n=1 Tax=Pangasianodon gigas TaxID=30993 RepID=A0ACC5XBT7_PANGG|nr:hypothetical protein [Pangasianodon gigas]